MPLDREWVEHIETLVNAAFDGQLHNSTEPAHKMICETAAHLQDRRLTMLYLLAEEMEELSSDKIDQLKRNIMRERSDAFFRNTFWHDLSAESKAMIDNFGNVSAGWGGDDELAAYYETSKAKNGHGMPLDLLLIGGADELPIFFHGEGNLITIAPPGAGKGQCQVLPNLLNYPGGIFVLDIKGENYEFSGDWRKGQSLTFEDSEWTEADVMRFAPDDHENSASWNPLDFINRDPLDIWDDCKALADLIIVPEKGDYFEERGRDLVAAVLQYIVMGDHDEKNMRQVCRVLWASPQELWKHFDAMKDLGSEFLTEAAEGFQGTAEKEFSGVINSARRSLEIWRSPRIAMVTAETTEGWTPAFIRNGGAVYLNIPPSKIQMYASVLRVLTGQHVYGIMNDRENVAEMPITFFLDEFPQLGYMKVFEDAADVGRDRKLRLWFFCQNLGQLKKHYSNYEGLLSSCTFQCFMNPNDLETAGYISARLGEKGGSFIDNKGASKVQPHELMGPDYKDKVIVLPRSMKPIKGGKAWLSDLGFAVNRLPEHLLTKYKYGD